MNRSRTDRRLKRAGTLGIIFASLTLFLPGGCATLESPQVAAGVPNGHYLTVAPFVVSSNFRLDEHDRVIQELVSMQAEVHDTLYLPIPTRQIELYIFNDRPTYERFIQTNYPELPPRRAFFIAQNEREIVYSFRGDRLEEDLRHEASHALLHAAMGTVPLWLDEGLAEYFETPGSTDGFHPRHALELKTAIGQGWRPGLTRLESLTKVSQMTGPDYREAWGWVYFLLHSSPESRRLLLAYLGDLRLSHPIEPLSSRLFRALPRVDIPMVDYLAHVEPQQPPNAVLRTSQRSGG
jgi:hypothetical protein